MTGKGQIDGLKRIIHIGESIWGSGKIVYKQYDSNMSGHSKWATIHRQKGVNDAKRGVIFTKLGRALTYAARRGKGVDDIVAKARQYNMPKENISRAIERGMGGATGEELHEATYEGFAPGGVAVMVNTVSDNKLRAAQQVREVLERGGGILGSLGSVSYLFTPMGEIIIKAQNLKLKTQDEQELEIIDLGVLDVETEEDRFIVYCDRDKISTLRDKLTNLDYKVETAELTMRPTALVVVTDEETRNGVEDILGKLSDLDDVQKVWTNLN